MSSTDIKKLRIRKEVIHRYYVLVGNDWQDIYGGPFDTKDEAKECIREAKLVDAESLSLV